MFYHRQSIIENVFLGTYTDFVLQLFSMQGKILVFVNHTSRSSFKLSDDHFYSCCLSCAVMPEKSENFTTVHIHI